MNKYYVDVDQSIKGFKLNHKRLIFKYNDWSHLRWLQVSVLNFTDILLNVFYIFTIML